MKNWKKLKIDSLPEDFMTREYEFISKRSGEIDYTSPWLAKSRQEKLTIIDNIGRFDYCYREPEQKAPSHSDVAFEYIRDHSLIVYGEVRMTKEDVDIWMRKAFIDGRLSMESADIPPETE